jgi:hypothetical protein
MSFSLIKDPDAVLDYGFNWSEWLADGETIVASVWTVPAGITKDSDSFTDTVSSIWLSGGIAGTNYDVVNHITTSAGRQDDRTIKIRVRNR